jgi:hypothetical protein
MITLKGKRYRLGECAEMVSWVSVLLPAQPPQRGLDPVEPLSQFIQAGIALGERPLVTGSRPLRCAKSL